MVKKHSAEPLVVIEGVFDGKVWDESIRRVFAPRVVAGLNSERSSCVSKTAISCVLCFSYWCG